MKIVLIDNELILYQYCKIFFKFIINIEYHLHYAW
jgi:hypothetical protein